MIIHNTYRPGSKRLAKDPSRTFSNNRPGLVLIRHGRIQGYEEKRFIGQTEVPLDPLGRQQACFWKQHIANIHFDRVYSSRLSRCRETAEIICPDTVSIPAAPLNEIHMGDWDGLKFSEIKNKHPQKFKQRGEHMDRFRPENGESFQDLSNRVLPFFIRLQTVSKRVLVVTHAGVIRVLLAHILGLPLKKIFKIRLEYGQIFFLDW